MIQLTIFSSQSSKGRVRSYLTFTPPEKAGGRGRQEGKSLLFEASNAVSMVDALQTVFPFIFPAALKVAITTLILWIMNQTQRAMKQAQSHAINKWQNLNLRPSDYPPTPFFSVPRTCGRKEKRVLGKATWDKEGGVRTEPEGRCRLTHQLPLVFVGQRGLPLPPPARGRQMSLWGRTGGRQVEKTQRGHLSYIRSRCVKINPGVDQSSTTLGKCSLYIPQFHQL